MTERQRYVAVYRAGTCAGKYLKAGGGCTDKLQEAQLIGWVSAKKGFRGVPWARDFSLFPAKIVLGDSKP